MAFEFTMKVVCAWCKKVMQEGAASKALSHGICTKCAEAVTKQIRRGSCEPSKAPL
jgi:hypothetical protein